MMVLNNDTEKLKEYKKLLKLKKYDKLAIYIVNLDTFLCEKIMVEIEKKNIKAFKKIFPNAKCGEYMRVIAHNRKKQLDNLDKL